MNERQMIAAKAIAGAIDEPIAHVWKIQMVFQDANLQGMNVETALERFHEVVQKCQEIERALTEQLPALEKLAQKQE